MIASIIEPFRNTIVVKSIEKKEKTYLKVSEITIQYIKTKIFKFNFKG